MKIQFSYILFSLILIGVFLFGCTKTFLDTKPNKSQVIPSTIKDLQGLLDNTPLINGGSAYALGEISNDDYFITKEVWAALSVAFQKNAYVWAKDIYGNDEDISDWNNSSTQILYANLSLEGIEKIKPQYNEESDWSNVKGSALFFRAYAFFNMAQLFCKSYDQQTAANDPGIPLRLESDITLSVKRASLQQTYNQIIADLMEAEELLPIMPLVKTRPSKPAVHAFLTRLYLYMGKYEESLKSANTYLSIHSGLMDYNDLDKTATYPFPMFNKEVIFHSHMSVPAILSTSRLQIDPYLYNSYNTYDLRKTLFFYTSDNGLRFKGTYYGSVSNYTGFATDEVLLTRAECYARLNDVFHAMEDLNTLCIKRFEANHYIPFSATNSNEALSLVLTERRKELLFRGIRWPDLKRLNKEPQFAKTLTRTLGDQIFSLPPNDPRYILPIPNEVIRLTGYLQNERE